MLSAQLAKAINILSKNTTIIFDGPAEEAEKWLHDRSHIDDVIVVVSSTDGPMPYTRKHMELAEEAGINPVGIWINKEECAAANPEIIELLVHRHYFIDNIFLERPSFSISPRPISDNLDAQFRSRAKAWRQIEMLNLSPMQRWKVR